MGRSLIRWVCIALSLAACADGFRTDGPVELAEPLGGSWAAPPSGGACRAASITSAPTTHGAALSDA